MTQLILIQANFLQNAIRALLDLFKDANSSRKEMSTARKTIKETGNGPTLAFKDIGQQVVAQLLNYYLGKQNRRANVVVETSGVSLIIRPTN